MKPILGAETPAPDAYAAQAAFRAARARSAPGFAYAPQATPADEAAAWAALDARRQRANGLMITAELTGDVATLEELEQLKCEREKTAAL